MFNKSLIKGVLLGAGALLVSAAAYAGKKTAATVVIVDTPVKSFSGSLGAVRNSSSQLEYLWCSASAPGVASGDFPGLALVECKAGNSLGTAVRCRSGSTSLRKAVETMNGDSYVSVVHEVIQGVDTCTSITVTNGSEYAPKLQTP